MKKAAQWFKELEAHRKVMLGVGVLAILAIATGSGNPKPTTLNATTASQKSQSSHRKPSKPNVTTKTETETQTIPFASTTAENAAMAKGTTKITTPGANGSQTLTYKVTYEGSKQTDKKLVSTEVTAQPVTQITSVGTYVAPAPQAAPSCPNGTYVNSAGNTVCSPYSSPSTPAGATARCVDGSYSFSQSRSGTCSHHGGVSQWL